MSAPASAGSMSCNNEVCFTVNGKTHKVSASKAMGMSLNTFLRTEAGLPGTKTMCNEGGCGCCAVAVTVPDPGTGTAQTFSINSCLCPVLSVDGWQVTTVEGIGNQRDGFHAIQSRIASFNGTQCGYCTPGFVMGMYGLLHEDSKPDAAKVESSLDGHICRCTGYRPVLEAFRSFASDSSLPGTKFIDIEDLNKHLCPKTGQACSSACRKDAGGQPLSLSVSSNGSRWLRPETLQELQAAVKQSQTSGAKVRFVFGNTASGVFKNEGPYDLYIDLHNVKDLYDIKVGEDVIQVGSNVTLTVLINKLSGLGANTPGFPYLPVVVKHLKKIGNHLMRNAATWTGNLMMKFHHLDFPSDLFTMMEAARAQVEVLDCVSGKRSLHSLKEFVTKVDMAGKLLTNLMLNKHNNKEVFRSFKVMPRSQNAHAYVNAGFLMTVDKEYGKLHIYGKPQLVFGGIDATLIHAEKTENYLSGKDIDRETVKEALRILKTELTPVPDPVLASPEYRRQLAANLLYKYLLGVGGAQGKARLTSGGTDLERPVSSSGHTFPEHKREWPLKQPMPKLTAPLQASGEAVFVNDMPAMSRELYGTFVLATVGPATLESVDPSPALAMEGVVDYLDAKDIPKEGKNSYVPEGGFLQLTALEIFCSGNIEFAGQPIGLILAESQELADKAARVVAVRYKDQQTPVVNIDQALAAGSVFPSDKGHSEILVGDPEEALKKSKHRVNGEVRMGTQYHFYMESVVALCVPSEDGLDVYTGSQWPTLTQQAMANALGKPMNYINMTVPRIGGGFGGKTFCGCDMACAAAIAAEKLRRPVRMSMDLQSNMESHGKRFPILATYQAGFDDEGKLDAISVDVIGDCGFSPNAMFVVSEILGHMDGAYKVPNFKVKTSGVKTHKAFNQPCRGPGPVPASFIWDSVLEHVAKSLGRSPILVKEINLYEDGMTDVKGRVLSNLTLKQVWNKLKTLAEVEKRQAEIREFNKNNQWKKRGLAMAPAKYPIILFPPGITVNVSIFAADGTVQVSQGGVEMGQGLFTKVAQAVAHALGIPVDTVKVRPCQGVISPNNVFTGGSATSEIAVQSALECCETLRARIEPIKAKHPDAPWQQLVGLCLGNGVDLSAKHTYVAPPSDGCHYFSCLAAVTEVELDVLTGEYLVRRVDILNDSGESLNPAIDIGQIEGAFVMGLGCMLLEDTYYDQHTGRVLNSGTWEYKPPTTKDIPVDWRIHLLEDANNPKGIRGSKAVGEPPLQLASTALFALRHAMVEVNQELNGSSTFDPVSAPLTVEKIQMGCGISTDKFPL